MIRVMWSNSSEAELEAMIKFRREVIRNAAPVMLWVDYDKQWAIDTRRKSDYAEW